MFNIQLPDIFYRRRFRFWLINVVSATVVLGIVAYLTTTGVLTQDLSFNLFTESFRADVSGGFINIFANDPVWVAFLKGIGNTLMLVVLGIFLASFIGLAIGIFRLAKHPVLSGIATVYVELFRNLPLLLIMYYFANVVITTSFPKVEVGLGIPNVLYFSNGGIATPTLTQNHGLWWIWVLLLVVALAASIALRIFLKRREDDTGKSTRPVLWSTVLFFGLAIITYLATVFPVGISLPSIDLVNTVTNTFAYSNGFILSKGYAAGLVALTLYFSAFIAEIVRGALLAIPHGQTEASQAIGLSAYQRLTLVILPQALRIMIPSINNEYQNLNKDAALTHLITYAEVVFVATQVANNRGNQIALFLGVFAVYVILNLIISTIMNLLNRSVQVTT